MKKPKTVVDAEVALAAKAVEVAVAKEALKRLESEWGIAAAAVRQAQTEADASLPQCRFVRVRRGGTEDGNSLVVIVRRTPGGMLVVRDVGESASLEYKFKWKAHEGKYQMAKHDGYTSTRELRDVPAEYLPVGSMTTTA